MAPENPSGDHPDTPRTGSHERPESLRSPEDWLAAEESSAHEPLHLPEDALFDDLVEEAGPPIPEPADTEPDEGMIDFSARDASESASISAPSELLSDPGDALADLPPLDPLGPGSGWLTQEGDEVLPLPEAPDLAAETSDVIAGQRKDLGVPSRTPDNSSIFDVPDGSGRFANPADPTETEAPELEPGGEFYLDASDEATGSSGELFGESAPDIEDLERDAAALLANLPPLPGPPEAGVPSDVVDLGSGVDLLDPEKESGVLGGGSSIFGAAPLPPDSDLERAAAGSGGRGDDVHARDADPDSNIFRSGPLKRDDSAVRTPGPASGDPPAEDDASGLVDWGTPGSAARLTDRMTAQEAAAQGVPDLRSLAETPRPAARLSEPRSTRERPTQPTAPRPEAARKGGGGVGWIGGTAVGLLAGLGLSAGAYFGGLVPNSETKSTSPVVAAANPADRQQIDDLTAKLSDATKAADDAKGDADKFRGNWNQTIGELNTARSQLTNAKKDVATARTERDAAKTDAKSAADRLTAEKTKADGLTTKVTQLETADADQKAMLAAKAKQLTDAQATAVEAAKKQKAADDALAGVVRELRASKLIDDKDDAAAAVAKLPEVLKKASAAAASADAQKAAAQLLAMKKESDAAKQALADAEKQLAAARAEVKTAVTAAEAAFATKLAASEERVREVLKERQQAEKAFATKLEALEADYARRLADARTGVVMPLSTGEEVARQRAAAAYHVGVDHYFLGRAADAEAALARATEADATDARYWYFLGLARFARGNAAGATEAFKKGADQEARSRPNRRDVSEALERVQGAARRAVNAHRP